MKPRARIESALQRLRARRLRFLAASSIVRGLAAASLVATAGILLVSTTRDDTHRIAVLAAIFLTALAPFSRLLLPRVRASLRPDALARSLEATFRELRTDVRASLEFATRPQPDDPVAARLRDALDARVADTLHGLGERLDAAVPRPRLHVPVRVLVVTALAAAALHTLAPDRFAPRLLAGLPVSDAPDLPRHALVVGALDLLVMPPGYTGLLSSRVPRATGTVQVLAGTRIQFDAWALVPTERAWLHLEAPDETRSIELQVLDAGRLRGDLVARHDARLVFEVEGPTGRVTDAVERTLRVLPDQPPTVELVEPRSDVEVVPDQILNLEYSALDDFGLAEVVLVWHFGGDERNQREQPLRRDVGDRRAAEHVPFDLQPLQLQPREEVVLWIEARDTNTLDGPGIGRSRPIRARVAAPEDRHAQVLEAKERLFESLLARLGDLLPLRLAAWKSAGEGDDRRVEVRPVPWEPEHATPALERAAETHAGWTETVAILRELLALMEGDELTVVRDAQLLTAAFDRLLQGERDYALALDRVRPAARAGDAVAAFDTLAERWIALVDATERATLLLEDLVASHRADDVERTLEEIDTLRDSLRDLLEQWRENRDPAVREQIERELRRLEARMRELLERLASQVDQLPQEHLNAEALQPSELQESVTEMTSSLDRVRQMLDQDDIEGAMQALEDLASGLDAMSGQMGRMESSAGGGLSEFDQGMAELMDELTEIEAREQGIAEATERLEQQMRERRTEELRESTRDALQQAREQLAEWERRVEQLDLDRLPSRVDAALQQTRSQTERLAESIETAEVAEAADRADQLISQLYDMEDLLREEMARLLRDPDAYRQAEATRRAMSEGVGVVDRLAEQMRALMDQAQPQPTSAESEQLGELAQRQQQARQQLQQLSEQASEFGERFPTGDELGEALRQAGEAMDGSSNELGGRRPRPAMQSQQRALQQLQSARQQMQRMMQRERQRQQQQGRDMDRERVEIPEESEGGNQRFRQEVIDAMREGALPSWEEEIRRYYDGLVR